MTNLADYEFAIFDCDGVIFDSNDLKINAFRLTLVEHPFDLVDTFIKYHKDNGGISRYVKLKYFFQEILKRDDFTSDYDWAVARYADIVKKELLNVDFIPGFEEFINKIRSRGMPAYVVSGGDESELQEVFAIRGIDYFDNIFGSPETKMKNTGKVIHTVGQAKKGIFFGDAQQDYLVAKAFNLDFVFVHGVSDWEEGRQILDDSDVLIVKDFNEL